MKTRKNGGQPAARANGVRAPAFQAELRIRHGSPESFGKMKIVLRVPAPFPEMLQQFAPKGVVVDYPPFEEKRGGLQDINWVEMSISWVGGAIAPLVLAYIVKYMKRFPMMIRTESGFEEFTPEIVERMLATAKKRPNQSPLRNASRVSSRKPKSGVRRGRS